MKGLLLAEKPSAMRAIREVYEKDPGIMKGDVLDFGAFHGHLMGLAPPDYYEEKNRKWRLDTLPIIPDKFVYLPTDEESVNALLAKIRSGGYDFIVNACDAGREGEHIFYSFYEANGLTLPVRRYWASDFTEKSIKAALENLMDPKKKEGLREASKLRAELDWLTGMNFTRAVSLVGGAKVNVGRVMSIVLKFVVDRENEIRSFVPKDFFEVIGTFSFGGTEYLGKHLLAPDFKNSRFENQKDAELIAAKLTAGKTGTVEDVRKKHSSISAPTLYSLTELQKDADKYWHYRADKTAEIAQSLYEAGLLTYPRTESRALPTAMAGEVMNYLKAIEGLPDLTKYVKGLSSSHIADVMKDKTYVDDSKIEDHHAIIPTDMPLWKAKKTLTKEESNIYLLVAKRFLSIFLPPYESESTTVITDVDGLKFTTSGKVELNKGFTELYVTKAKDVILPAMKRGDKVQVVRGTVKGGKTQPPDRYTTSTLLDAMLNVSSKMTDAQLRKVLRDSKGIGTTATRASIIKKVEDLKMMEVQKNHFVPTAFGDAIINAIGDRDICSPILTAQWEQKLYQVETGEVDRNTFRREMIDYICTETDDIIANDTKIHSILGDFDPDAVVVGTCPVCGKPVVEGKNTYYCSGFKPVSTRKPEDCGFAFGKEVLGAKISVKDAKAILAGETVEKKMFSSKTKKEYTAPLGLKRESVSGGRDIVKIGPIFNAKAEEVDPSTLKETDFLGECPVCGGKVYEGPNCFVCVNKNKGCSYTLSKKLKGQSLTRKDAEALLAGKSIRKVWTWKSGNKSERDCRLNEHGIPDFGFQK